MLLLLLLLRLLLLLPAAAAVAVAVAVAAAVLLCFYRVLHDAVVVTIAGVVRAVRVLLVVLRTVDPIKGVHRPPVWAGNSQNAIISSFARHRLLALI